MSTRTRRITGLLLALPLCSTALGLQWGGIYGLTLFALCPAMLGALVSWVTRPDTGAGAAGRGALAGVAGACCFLILGRDGALCVTMSLPLAVPMAALSSWVTYRINRSSLPARGVAMLLLVPSATFTWDVSAPPPVFQVHTEIEVAAAPERVWKHVVSFPELPEPHEWYFRTGLAYPVRARIEGSGPGAVRYCEFSTGAFVEPIEIWDEPRLLRFRVTENPAPMREWGLYGSVEPRHLHGYMVSRQGQFRLTGLENGHTRLEGTTWYQHGLWPAQYWRWWSDAIIHRIHLRVLEHVRQLAEQE